MRAAPADARIALVLPIQELPMMLLHRFRTVGLPAGPVTALLLAALVAPRPGHAQDAEPDAGLSEGTAAGVVEQAMRARGLTPPTDGDGLAISDYVTTFVNSSGQRRVALWIGPDGAIIPGSDWREAHEGSCGNRNRFIEGATKALIFKLYPEPAMAAVQYMDVETGRIEHQKMVEAGQGEGLAQAVGTAWDQIETPIGGLTGPYEGGDATEGWTFYNEEGVATLEGGGMSFTRPMPAEPPVPAEVTFTEDCGSFTLRSGSRTLTFDRVAPDAVDFSPLEAIDLTREDLVSEDVEVWHAQQTMADVYLFGRAGARGMSGFLVDDQPNMLAVRPIRLAR